MEISIKSHQRHVFLFVCLIAFSLSWPARAQQADDGFRITGHIESLARLTAKFGRSGGRTITCLPGGKDSLPSTCAWSEDPAPAGNLEAGMSLGEASIRFGYFSVKDSGLYQFTRIKLTKIGNDFEFPLFYQGYAGHWGSVEFGIVEGAEKRLSAMKPDAGFFSQPRHWMTGLRVYDDTHEAPLAGNAPVKQSYRPIAHYATSFATVSIDSQASGVKNVPRVSYYSPDNLYGFQFGMSYGVANHVGFKDDGSEKISLLLLNQTPFESALPASLIHFGGMGLDFDLRIDRKTKFKIALNYGLRTRVSRNEGRVDRPSLAQGYRLSSSLEIDRQRYELGFMHNINAVDAILGPENCQTNTTRLRQRCRDSFVLHLLYGYSAPKWSTFIEARLGIIPAIPVRQVLPILVGLAENGVADESLQSAFQAAEKRIDLRLGVTASVDYFFSDAVSLRFQGVYDYDRPALSKSYHALYAPNPGHTLTGLLGFVWNF